jgi:2-polyprenyl-3-methyl-5-hydroxy-6-metoxy-1,4-benzoquinol methylase
MSILRRISLETRRFIAGRFPGRLPRLYSTLDAPDLRVPVQEAAYWLATRKYIRPGDTILDVGFGLGYGLEIMSEKSGELRGIEIDRKAVSYGQVLQRKVPKVLELRHYDGQNIPYDANAFDIVTCIDVLEHVPNYMHLLNEMLRVSRRVTLLSSPNCRPENTRPDGRPKNRWHLREWSVGELALILDGSSSVHWEWNFINGPWEGPFTYSHESRSDTLALAPALFVVTKD